MSRSQTGRNLAWTTIALLGSKGAMFASIILIARAISPAQFGQYVVTVAAASILMPVLDGGFVNSVTRAASRRDDVPQLSFTATAARMRLPLWGCMLGFGFLGGLLGVAGHWELLVLAVLSAIGQAQLDTMSGELRARGRYRLAALREASCGCVALCGATALLLTGGNATGAMVVFAAARVLPALAFLPMIPRALPAIRGDIPWRAGLTMGLTGIVIALYVRSDMLLLSWLKIDPAVIARYGIAYNLVIAFQILPTAIATTIFPRLASATGEEANRLARKGMSLSYLSCALLCIACFLSPRLVFAPFGSTYSDHAAQVAPLLLIILPISLSQISTATLQARNYEVLMLRMVGAVAAVNIGLNILLIPLLGVRGAIFATMTGELCAAALTLATMHRSNLGSYGLGYIPAVALVFAFSMSVPGPALVSIALLVSGIALWRTGILSVTWARPLLARRSPAASAA
jgi:O-antigen/teichoic acid export membrane protein